jgi:hypothetical protein
MPPAFVLSQDQTLRLTVQPIPLAEDPARQSTEARSLTHYCAPTRPKPGQDTSQPAPGQRQEQVNASSKRHAKQDSASPRRRPRIPSSLLSTCQRTNRARHRCLVARGRTYTSGPTPCQTLSARFPQLRRSCAETIFDGAFSLSGQVSGPRPANGKTNMGNAVGDVQSSRGTRPRPTAHQSISAFRAVPGHAFCGAKDPSPTAFLSNPIPLQKRAIPLNQARP